jgi:hypothetical protein
MVGSMRRLSRDAGGRSRSADEQLSWANLRRQVTGESSTEANRTREVQQTFFQKQEQQQRPMREVNETRAFAVGFDSRPHASRGAKASWKEGSIKPTCRENLGEVPEGDCTPVRVVRVRPVRAVNERPLIAAVPIGHRDDATALSCVTASLNCSQSVVGRSTRGAESHPGPIGDICCRGDAP